MTAATRKGLLGGAGLGLIFGAVFHNPGVGLVIGAAVGLAFPSLLARAGFKSDD